MIGPGEGRRAFTLIEILVVSAILVMLAGLLTPVFLRAKAAAGDSTCVSNLASIGKAIALYAAANDDFAPIGSAGEGNSISVKPLLAPYGLDVKNWRCPRDRWFMDVVEGHMVTDMTPNYDRFGSSYVYDGRSARLGRSMTFGMKPAETLLASDRFAYHSDVSEPDGLFNVLYRDLHVKATRWSKRDDIRWPDDR
ncbi:MAG TPA: type II secretion system protein [Fimbriimonas sp.]